MFPCSHDRSPFNELLSYPLASHLNPCLRCEIRLTKFSDNRSYLSSPLYSPLLVPEKSSMLAFGSNFHDSYNISWLLASHSNMLTIDYSSQECVNVGWHSVWITRHSCMYQNTLVHLTLAKVPLRKFACMHLSARYQYSTRGVRNMAISVTWRVMVLCVKII